MPIEQLKAVLATLSGEVIVQFTSEDPNCGYCVRGNRDMPLARPLEGIPVAVVLKDGRETDRVNGAGPRTQSLPAPPAAAPKRDPAAR